jgi:hypothetical protein
MNNTNSAKDRAKQTERSYLTCKNEKAAENFLAIASEPAAAATIKLLSGNGLRKDPFPMYYCFSWKIAASASASSSFSHRSRLNTN